MPVKEFRMARWYVNTSAIATMLLVSAGIYGIFWASDTRSRLLGAVMVLFGTAAFADTLMSRIVLDDEEIRLISIMRTRRYPRADFESAKADGGAVALKRKDGGWLVLPSTGHNALSVRNAVHDWARRERETQHSPRPSSVPDR